jgi:hypothetical protein
MPTWRCSVNDAFGVPEEGLDEQKLLDLTGFNGMDAPARHGISCAKVEVSSNHLNRQERP